MVIYKQRQTFFFFTVTYLYSYTKLRMSKITIVTVKYRPDLGSVLYL